MSFLQQVWIFDPWEFHSYLAGRAVDDDYDDLDIWALIREARSAAKRVAQSQSYLKMIRFSQEWLTERATLGQLYVVCMAPFLKAGPSSREILWLREYLEQIGWNEPDSSSIVIGEPLALMLDHVGHDPLGRAVRESLLQREYGGWLSSSCAMRIRRQLEKAEQAFRVPDREYVAKTARYSQQSEGTVAARISRLYDGAIEMLSSLNEQESQALRLVAD